MSFSTLEISKLKRHMGLTLCLFLFLPAISMSNERKVEEDLTISGHYVYKGTINGNLPVTMAIVVNKLTDYYQEKGKRNITGWYYYDKKKINIFLKGYLKGNSFSLQEYSDRCKKTGSFIGTDVGRNNIKGNWVSPKGEKFSLELKLVEKKDKKTSIISRVGGEGGGVPYVFIREYTDYYTGNNTKVHMYCSSGEVINITIDNVDDKIDEENIPVSGASVKKIKGSKDLVLVDWSTISQGNGAYSQDYFYVFKKGEYDKILLSRQSASNGKGGFCNSSRVTNHEVSYDKNSKRLIEQTVMIKMDSYRKNDDSESLCRISELTDKSYYKMFDGVFKFDFNKSKERIIPEEEW